MLRVSNDVQIYNVILYTQGRRRRRRRKENLIVVSPQRNITVYYSDSLVFTTRYDGIIVINWRRWRARLRSSASHHHSAVYRYNTAVYMHNIYNQVQQTTDSGGDPIEIEFTNEPKRTESAYVCIGIPRSHRCGCNYPLPAVHGGRWLAGCRKLTNFNGPPRGQRTENPRTVHQGKTVRARARVRQTQPVVVERCTEPMNRGEPDVNRGVRARSSSRCTCVYCMRYVYTCNVRKYGRAVRKICNYTAVWCTRRYDYNKRYSIIRALCTDWSARARRRAVVVVVVRLLRA